MSGQFFLHIGAMKTGTSFLQGVLTANKQSLRAAGVLAPSNRSAAVHDLVDFRGATEGRTRGAWAELVHEVAAFDGRAAVLSHEYLSLQGRRRVDEVVASLEGFDLHVVLTVRDAAAVLPAQWQTAARNSGRDTWPEYVAAADDDTVKPAAHTFRRAQRVGRILKVWSHSVGADRIHVVTVPPPTAPRLLLWERFAEVIGVDPALATDTQVRSNPSAGYATAHLLCLVHAEAERRELSKAQVRRLSVFVADRAAVRRAEEPTPPLDESALHFAARWNRWAARTIERAGVDVVGTLADLPTTLDLSVARPLVPPSDDAVVRAAHAAAETLAPLTPTGAGAARWSSVDAAARGVVDLIGAAIESGGVERLTSRGTGLREDG